jgi:hypothetical protein
MTGVPIESLPNTGVPILERRDEESFVESCIDGIVSSTGKSNHTKSVTLPSL